MAGSTRQRKGGSGAPKRTQKQQAPAALSATTQVASVTTGVLLVAVAAYFALRAQPPAPTRASSSGAAERKGVSADADAPCPCSMEKWQPPPPESVKYEMTGGRVTDDCDFDTIDAEVSQAEFDRLYWNNRPVRIRNGTRNWPATAKWTKQALSDTGNGSALWYMTSDYHASARSIGTELSDQRGRQSIKDFLCHDICHVPAKEADGVKYIFDRETWRETGMNGLYSDIVFPEYIMSHFSAPDWHVRVAAYWLMGGFGSGANLHVHTHAFNGAVRGRKRWFLFNQSMPPAWKGNPPGFEHDMLKWYREFYPSTSDRVIQCMQEEGDLLYVPMGWWHGTLNLGEGVAISGQFVRRATDLMNEVMSEHKAGNLDSAIEKAKFLAVNHADELESDVYCSISIMLGSMLLEAGRFNEARKLSKILIKSKGPLQYLNWDDKCVVAGREIKARAKQKVNADGVPTKQTD